jgi:hypothetical protein
VLEKYINNGIIRCNIKEVEKQILEEHLPIEKNFKFLCCSWYVAYDSQVKKTTYQKE